ncbi:hypothetical protein RA19_10245 [Leisingera sp. ANG-M1]|nr:hypothetical protein RA19_10245 [Leisingera sp. ANG-M1]
MKKLPGAGVGAYVGAHPGLPGPRRQIQRGLQDAFLFGARSGSHQNAVLLFLQSALAGAQRFAEIPAAAGKAGFPAIVVTADTRADLAALAAAEPATGKAGPDPPVTARRPHRRQIGDVPVAGGEEVLHQRSGIRLLTRRGQHVVKSGPVAAEH